MSHAPVAVVRGQDSIESIIVARCRGASMKVLLGEESGVPNFITRLFSLEAGGRIPCHRHDTIEHEQLVISGTMIIGLSGREIEVTAGDGIFIPAGVDHWYENRKTDPVQFVCVVPRTDDYQTEWLEGPAE